MSPSEERHGINTAHDRRLVHFIQFGNFRIGFAFLNELGDFPVHGIGGHALVVAALDLTSAVDSDVVNYRTLPDCCQQSARPPCQNDLLHLPQLV